MERFTIEVRDEAAAQALRDSAAAHGRSVEDEISAIVSASATGTRTPPAYPAGYEPLPGESFVDHIIRVSRPGFDLEIDDDDLFAVRDPYSDAG